VDALSLSERLKLDFIGRFSRMMFYQWEQSNLRSASISIKFPKSGNSKRDNADYLDAKKAAKNPV